MKKSLIKISATDGQVKLGCGHCGVSVLLDGEMTTRGFARHLNTFKEAHEWKCYHVARDKKIIADSQQIFGNLMSRVTSKTV